jgi:5'-nucleotidase
MKKYIYILVCLVLCLNLSAQEYKSFTVLHTNDTHSCIEPFKQENGHLVGG